ERRKGREKVGTGASVLPLFLSPTPLRSDRRVRRCGGRRVRYRGGRRVGPGVPVAEELLDGGADLGALVEHAAGGAGHEALLRRGVGVARERDVAHLGRERGGLVEVELDEGADGRVGGAV